jgi:uncharacterized membrane protein YeiH
MRGFIVAVCAAILLSGCASMPDQQRNTLIGIGVGAGVGALVGSAVVGGPGAVAVGAAIGGTTGGVIGSMIRPDACYILNRRRELWQVPCGYRPAGTVACFYGRGPGAVEQVDCPSRQRLKRA